VSNLDDLGTAVIAATRAFGSPPEERPFAGHLTLARGRGRRSVPAAVAGDAVSGSWDVREFALIRSHLGASGARYETLETVGLRGAPGG
jgi:2'-5' RNA ligase